VLELPAGLIDEGETASEAAVRELREETGLIGSAVSESPVIFSDPGMSNANMRLVEVLVDLDDARNISPEQALEEGEDIKVHMVETSDLQQELLDLAEREEAVVDARLWSVAFGRATSARDAKPLPTLFPFNRFFDKQMLAFTGAVFVSTAIVGGLVKALLSRSS